jgi:hypothetical protein
VSHRLLSHRLLPAPPLPFDAVLSLDPALLGVVSAALEQESAAAYGAGFADGFHAARFRLPPDADPPADDEAPDGATRGADATGGWIGAFPA